MLPLKPQTSDRVCKNGRVASPAVVSDVYRNAPKLYPGGRQMTGAKVARRGVNYPLLGLALIGLAIAKLASIYWEMQNRMQHSTFGFDG